MERGRNSDQEASAAESALQVVEGGGDEDVFEQPLTRERRVAKLRQQLHETLADLEKLCKEAKSDEVTATLSDGLVRVDEMVRDLCEQVDDFDQESPGGDIEFFTGSSAREVAWRRREDELREELNNDFKKQASRLSLQHKIEMGALICGHKKSIDKYLEHKVKAEQHAKLLREVNKELGLKAKGLKRRAELMQQTMQGLREQLALALNANTELEFESLQEVENYRVRVDMMERDAKESERLRYSEDDVKRLVEDLERSHMRELEEVVEEERGRRAEEYVAMQSDLRSEHRKEMELAELQMDALRQALEQRHSQPLPALAADGEGESGEASNKHTANVEARAELEAESSSREQQQQEEKGKQEEKRYFEYGQQLAALQEELVHVLSLLNDTNAAGGDAEEAPRGANGNSIADAKSASVKTVTLSPELQQLLAVRGLCRALRQRLGALPQQCRDIVPLSALTTSPEELSVFEQERASLKEQLQTHQEKGRGELPGEAAVKGGTADVHDGAAESLEELGRSSLKLEQFPSSLQAQRAALQKEREEVFRAGWRLRELLLECGHLVRGAPSPGPSPGRGRAEGAAPVADEPLSLWALLEELETRLRTQVSADTTSLQGATVQLFTISEEPEEAASDVANPEKPRKKEKLKKALRDKKARAARTAADVPPPPRPLLLGPNGALPASMEPAPEGSVWAGGAELGVCEVLTTVPLPPGVVAPPGAEGRISVRTRIFRYHDEADDASGARIATEIVLPTPPYRSEQGYEVETRLIQDTTRTGARVAREITSRVESDARSGKIPKQTRGSLGNSTEGLPGLPGGPQLRTATDTDHPQPEGGMTEPVGSSLSAGKRQTERDSKGDNNEGDAVEPKSLADGQLGRLQADTRELGSLMAQKDSEIESLLVQLKSREEEAHSLHDQVSNMASELHALHGQIQEMARQRSQLEATESDKMALRNNLTKGDLNGPPEHSANEAGNGMLSSQVSDKDAPKGSVNSPGKEFGNDEGCDGDNDNNSSNVDDDTNVGALSKINERIEELEETIRERDSEIGAMGRQVQELRLQLQERSAMGEAAATASSSTQTDGHTDPEALVGSDGPQQSHTRSVQAEGDDPNAVATRPVGEDGGIVQRGPPEGRPIVGDMAGGLQLSAKQLGPSRESDGLGSEENARQQDPRPPEGEGTTHGDGSADRHGDVEQQPGSGMEEEEDEERFHRRLLEDEDVKMLLTRIRQTDQELVHVNLQLAQQGAPLGDSSLLSQLLRQLAGLTEHVCSLTAEKAALRRTVLAMERENGHIGNAHPARRANTEPGGHASGQPGVGEAHDGRHVQEEEEEREDCEQDPFESGCIPTPSVPADKFAEVYEQFLQSERHRRSLIFQKQYLLLALSWELGRRDGGGGMTAMTATAGSGTALKRLRTAVRAVMAARRFQLQGHDRQLYYQLPGAQQEHQALIPSPYMDCDGCCLHGSARHLSRVSSCVSLDGDGRRQGRRRGHGRACACALCAGDHGDPDKALLDYISKLDDIQLRLGQHYAEPLLVQYRSKRI
uniref:Rootletin-like isoform X1 n=2 Tax=Petromyzon marinus TaxID=7757 RepID=A0AAJ7WLT5_PETMA|nr:rootletin-like isoform X1 [Petromyzon marinus]